jgi:hypothetical protein
MNAGDLAIIVMQDNGTSTRNYNCANADGSGSNTWQAAAGKADTTWGGIEFWYSVLSVGVSSGTTLSCSTTISGGGFLITAAAFRPTGTASFDTNATAATGGGASVSTITSGPTPTLACPSGGANCDVCVGASSWGAGNPSSDATFTTFGGTGSGVPWTDAFKRVSATTAQSYTATNTSSNQADCCVGLFQGYSRRRGQFLWWRNYHWRGALMLQRFISFATAAVLILAALPVFVPAPAEARFPHGSASGTCLQAVDNGCAGADQTAIWQDPNALINAKEMGQTWVSNHPTTKNVPGVDYPLGPAGLTLFKDPSIDPLPCGTYDAVNHRVLCNDGAASYTFDGWDFTHAGAYNHPISLQFGPNTTGVCTVTNSKFLVDSTSGTLGESPVWFKNGDCRRVFDHNICSGSGASGAFVPCIEDDSRSSSNSAEFLYNAFPNQSFMRVITAVGSGGAGDTWDFCYNYVYGLGAMDDGGATHGEIDLYGGQSPGGVGYTVTRKKWCSNFIVWSKNSTTVNNATLLAGTGDYNNMKVLNTIMDSNVIIANPYGGVGGGATVGRVLVDGKWANFRRYWNWPLIFRRITRPERSVPSTAVTFWPRRT